MIPQAVAGLLTGVLDQVLGAGAGPAFTAMESSEAPLATLGYMNAWTLIALGTAAAVLLAFSRRGTSRKGPTWGCGYARADGADAVHGAILRGDDRPSTCCRGSSGPGRPARPLGDCFPSRSDFGSACPDPVSEKLYEPFFRRWADRFSQLRILQQGKVHIYLVYMVLTVVLALAWVSIRR